MTRKSVTKKKETVGPTDLEENTREVMFVLAEHWQSDLKFFSDELRFLTSLIDKYFIWLIKEKNIKNTRVMAVKLTRFEKRRFALDQKVEGHLKHLTNLIANPFSHNAQAYKDEHGELKINLSDFVKDFRVMKKEIFGLTEQIIGSEKDHHLLRN